MGSFKSKTHQTIKVKLKDMNLTIKFMLCMLCLNLNTPAGKAENFYTPAIVENVVPSGEKKNIKEQKKPKKHLKKKLRFRLYFGDFLKMIIKSQEKMVFEFLQKNKKLTEVLFRNKFKKINPLRNNPLEYQQTDWEYTLRLIYFSLAAVGIVTFIVGAALVNPLIWIIGGAAFLIGYICWIFHAIFPVPYYSAAVSILFAIIFAVIGVVLFFIGLTIGTLALWVGGLIFLLPIIIWGLLVLFILIIQSFYIKKQKSKEN
jgi:hypothetical protein